MQPLAAVFLLWGARSSAEVLGEQQSCEEQPSHHYPVGSLFFILPTLSVMMRPIFLPFHVQK